MKNEGGARETEQSPKIGKQSRFQNVEVGHGSLLSGS